MMMNFKILLWLIAIHSCVAGLLLIILGDEGMQFFGFMDGNAFFQVQGGVFHLVMCVAYVMAAMNLKKSKQLIIFIILAKTIALLYLLAYFIFIDQILVVLISGIADGLMALMVYFFYRRLHNNYFEGGKV